MVKMDNISSSVFITFQSFVIAIRLLNKTNQFCQTNEWRMDIFILGPNIQIVEMHAILIKGEHKLVE
jgi:hypothetical protein